MGVKKGINTKCLIHAMQCIRVFISVNYFRKWLQCVENHLFYQSQSPASQNMSVIFFDSFSQQIFIVTKCFLGAGDQN